MKTRTGKNHLLLKGWLALSMTLSVLPAAGLLHALPVQAQEEDTDAAGRVRLFASTGSVWNGSAPLALHVEGAQGTALDDEVFVLTKGADKYEIKDGQVVLKEGMSARTGDEIEVQAALSWYEPEQLLWNENLETEGSLTPSVAGKYCLQHSETRPRHGTKSGTTMHTNVKDGMWSPAIGSEGTLVFWYYDPATEEELDAEALAARTSPAFDQMKFGMTINNYPDFLFGVAIPASGDKGAEGTTMSVAERMAYAGSYIVRFGGNWHSTNIERTTGWHKMEARVTSQGTTLKIDGEDVCEKGSDVPLQIPGVKSIAKAGFATNWGDKKENTEFVEEKHFIDDVYIVRPGQEQAHETVTSLNIRVRTEEAAEDEAAVQASLEAAEALDWQPLQAKTVPDQKTAEELIRTRVQAVCQEGVQASVDVLEWKAPVNGTKDSPAGERGRIAFSLTFTCHDTSRTGFSRTLDIVPAPYDGQTLALNPLEEGAVLREGETLHMVLDGADSAAIDSITYTTDNENVLVAQDGTLSLKEGYTPKAGETITVQAQVQVYDPQAVHFADSFEGDKQFTAAASGSYAHSGTRSLFGRQAATPYSSTNGYPRADLGSLSDVRVSAWYYDTGNESSQLKYGFGINGNSTALGIFYDGVIAPYANNLTRTHYGNRIAGFTYNDYAWGTTDAPRTEGWHHFEWLIDSEKGLTEKVDGKIVSTNSKVGKTGTVHELVKAENLSAVKELNSLVLMNGWNNNAQNLAEIADRHFIDGVIVTDLDAQPETVQVVSEPVELAGITYLTEPSSLQVSDRWPEARQLRLSPYLGEESEIASVSRDGQELDAALWTTWMQEAPVNAANYPESLKGYTLSVQKEAFSGLEAGDHVLQLQLQDGSEVSVPVQVQAEEHEPAVYYLSNSGDDANDGRSEETPWKSFEKLSTVTFGPGDTILLDAESVWSHVQFRPEGSGAEGAPVVLSSYNNGGDSSKRPVLNGDGTLADLQAHSYVAFDAWRAFYPSGTIELFNVDHWEIRDVEITNYAQEMQKGATGRNGIAVIHDYFETQDITSVPSSNADREKAFYSAGKLQHIVIDNCYIHDVVGYHPANGAQGRGGKMSGGINVYGPYDDVQITNNIVMYCDVEGIRNDVLAWMGDTRTQFPAYMEDIVVANNYIAGVPGDGVVISSAVKPVIENNYLTDAGYSYFAKTRTSNVSGVTWNTSNLSSCRNVAEKTGGTVKEMGNRQSPITMGATNFAGLWFIGTKDAAAQYNEASNNVWTCNDGEAFDADMYCSGTIFQYNYTYRNNGGFALFMPTMDEGTVVRYNISVEDGQSLGIDESQNGLFHYIGTPELIHNNVFLLSDSLNTLFGGSSNTAWFYNNIVAAPNGLSETGSYGGFHINGSSDGNVQNPKLSGALHNNLFYPAGITDSIVSGSSVSLQDNIVLNEKEELDAVFEDLDSFLEAQPLKALRGRSALSGETVNGLELGKGAGVAMSAKDGAGVQTPTGGFDLSQFAGLRLSENSPALAAGTRTMRTYAYQAQNEAAWPLEKDFYDNALDSEKPLDLGVHQKSSEKAATPDPDVQPWRDLLQMCVEEALRVQQETDWNPVHPSVKSYFETSLAAAQALLANSQATAEELQQAWKDLSRAIQMVGFTADKAELQELVSQAEAIDPDTLVDGEAKDAFLAALEHARNVLADPDALDETSIRPACEALRQAMSQLERKPETVLDTAMLELLLSVSKDAAEHPERYASACHAAFVQARNEAEAVLAEAETQEKIDAAAGSLHATWLNLRLLADESLLQEIAGALQTLLAMDPVLFSEPMLAQRQQLAEETQAWLTSAEPEERTGLALLHQIQELSKQAEKQTGPSEKPAVPENPSSAARPGAEPDQNGIRDLQKQEPVVVQPSVSSSNSTGRASSVRTAAFFGPAASAAGLAPPVLFWMLKKRRRNG